MLGGWRTAVQIRGPPLVALAAAVAQQVERRLSVLFAVSAAHEVGLGLCSLGSARPTIRWAVWSVGRFRRTEPYVT